MATAKKQLTHHDYAEEAGAAERAEAWPQAAALWLRAAEALRASNPAHNLTTHAIGVRYQTSATMCDRKAAADAKVAEIAKRVLRIDTLETRNADGLDFHELSVWQIKKVLLAAYDAGRDAEG